MKYHKIQSLYVRNRSTKRLTIGDFSNPVFAYLQYNQWRFTEKVDGMNMRIGWDGEQWFVGGKTDNALIPTLLVKHIDEMFSPILKETLLNAVGGEPFTLYGEGYGGKIQGGGKYSPEPKFVAFDLRVNRRWLDHATFEGICGRLGIPTVPCVGWGTLEDAVAMVARGQRSCYGDFDAEGIVARPIHELTDSYGDRVIVKIRACDYTKEIE